MTALIPALISLLQGQMGGGGGGGGGAPQKSPEEIARDHANRLLANGGAYPDFGELPAMRGPMSIEQLNERMLPGAKPGAKPGAQ